MKKAVVLTVVVAFLLSVSAVFAVEGTAPAKKAPVKVATVKAKSETFTGTVLENKVDNKSIFSVQTDADTIELAGPKAALVGKNVGKKVKVTGVVKDVEGKKVLTVASFSVVREPAPKKEPVAPKKAQ